MKFAFIAEHREVFSVYRMCELLEVSRSGFYAWLEREPGQREQDNDALLIEIQRIYELSRATYGSPRIHAQLEAEGS